MRFAKGHGTGNDFIVVPDVDDHLELGPDVVRALCDRRTGIGADGVLRVVRREFGPAPWFMDYRNADGSVAEMCGNGIRVYARYLLDHGLAAGPEITIATRSGVRTVRERPGGQLTVDMGPVSTGRTGWALIGGRRYTGLAVTVGNPHLVCLIGKPIDGIDMSGPPEVDPGVFPGGVNVELARITGDHRLQMRVHERGSGETLSCGTGAVAAAVAAAASVKQWPGTGAASWIVDVPGGRLAVAPSATASLLTGPAVIVAEGETSHSWMADPVVATTPVTA
ncbi:MAG TPA: diaminopimelate epimerase [Streptosporangiaceae bacterium]|nr:diaminopimelate epimerase [Streptosporangiaceae bacterium]